MQDQLKCLAVALAAASVTAACGLVGSPPNQPPVRAVHITIGGNTRRTEHVSCTQDQWAFTIQADAPPGRARAFFQLGEQEPIVKTVNIENIDCLNGTAGGNLGDAKASTDGDIYTITGTDRAHPGQAQKLQFEFKAPC